MGRLSRAVRSRLPRPRGVERFVRLIVGGGLALVVGLWVAALSNVWSPPWLLGTALALLGTVALAAGIRRELDSP